MDNCTQYEKDDPEKFQTEATRIVTGTTKLVSLEILNSEIGCDTFDIRRNKQKLTLIYKMAQHLTLHYLTSLIPSTVTETSSCNCRNLNKIRAVSARTSQYVSFLSSTIREWNNLPEEQRTH